MSLARVPQACFSSRQLNTLLCLLDKHLITFCTQHPLPCWEMGSCQVPQTGRAATRVRLFPMQFVADAQGQTQREEIAFYKRETL